MLVIGVTGGLGTGKSTVARLFGQLGAAVLDADAIVRELLRPGRAAWRDVVRAFGRRVVRADRTIDRPRLAAIVFADPARRRRLEALLHPRVLARIRRDLRRLRQAGRVPAVVLDVPLLIETGAHRDVDALVVVTAPATVQRRRLQARGWTREGIEARSAAQWALSAKVALADYVVDNADGLAATRTQVTRIWKELAARSRQHRPIRARRRASSTSRR